MEAVNKFFPESDETQKGHMNQQLQNVRYTKINPEEPEEEEEKGKGNSIKGKQMEVCIKVYDYRETMYTDQTGRFPVYSSSGNRYIMVMCEVDSNAILVAPMKNIGDQEMHIAYRELLQRLNEFRVNPTKHILDNEASTEVTRVIKETCQLELVPPDVHRSNRREGAIKTFKNHFIAIFKGG